MANTEDLFCIIQLIPSPKAEPLKRWLAKVGYERVREIEDPELAASGLRPSTGPKVIPRPGSRSGCAALPFGLTPSEYKNLKGLERENLRDHMTDLELIFSMLGEASTTEIARKKDVQGFGENKKAARKGGKIAGDAREKLEAETGSKVVSQENYLTEPESRKRLMKK